jgi:hypothetical protein
MERASEGHGRLKKRPHSLHRSTSAEELLEQLEAKGINLVSLVYEFIKRPQKVGILITGSIAEGIANCLSDVDVLILVPTPAAYKERKREVFGSSINYLPTNSPVETEVSLFLQGIEFDMLFVVDPALPEPSTAIAAEAPSEREEILLATRLAQGWVVDGREVVDSWNRRFSITDIRIRWMAAKFAEAAKILEDMEVGIGRARGHVACLGAHVVRYLLSALLAYHHFYASSANWMLKVNQLIEVVDSAMREALMRGAELAFPTLLDGADEEKEYFERVYAYCGDVRELLSREENMGDVLASIIYDLDIILPFSPSASEGPRA